MYIRVVLCDVVVVRSASPPHYVYVYMSPPPALFTSEYCLHSASEFCLLANYESRLCSLH